MGAWLAGVPPGGPSPRGPRPHPRVACQGDCVLPGGTRRGGVLHWPRRTMRCLPDHHHRRSPRAAGAPRGGLQGPSARGWRGTSDSLAWRPFLGSLLGLSRARAPLQVGKAERGPVARAPGSQAGRLGEEALLPSCSRGAALHPSHAAGSSGPDLRPPRGLHPSVRVSTGLRLGLGFSQCPGHPGASTSKAEETPAWPSRSGGPSCSLPPLPHPPGQEGCACPSR